MERHKNICDIDKNSKPTSLLPVHDYIYCAIKSAIPKKDMNKHPWENKIYTEDTQNQHFTHCKFFTFKHIYGKHFNRKPWLQDFIEVKHWLLHVNNKQLQLKANPFNKSIPFRLIFPLIGYSNVVISIDRMIHFTFLKYQNRDRGEDQIHGYSFLQ